VANKINKMYENINKYIFTDIPDQCSFEKDKLPRTSLVLRPQQMITEGYPKPDEENYVPTHEDYDPVSDRSPLFSLHCEIVYNQTGEIEIAWVVLVNEYLEVFQEIFVKPDESYMDILKK